jgi:hypothetical protein
MKPQRWEEGTGQTETENTHTHTPHTHTQTDRQTDRELGWTYATRTF